MTQNTSSAVMHQRVEAHDSLDYFPTPPWATRALCEQSVGDRFSAWEPACGEGAMLRPLREYAAWVFASDVHDYGQGNVLHDFLLPFLPVGVNAVEWIITNPLFRLGEQFARRALALATKGVALLVRTGFLESIERFKLFQEQPPAEVLQFAERVPMVKGRLHKDASTATSYCWIVWRAGETDTRLRWIPPCRRRLERVGDYQ